jgi:hypothetical protein
MYLYKAIACFEDVSQYKSLETAIANQIRSLKHVAR